MSVPGGASHDPLEEMRDPPQLSSRRGLWFCRAAILCILGLMLVRAWRSHSPAAQYGGWTIENSADLGRWLIGIAWRQFVIFCAFLVLGVLLPTAWAAREMPLTSNRWLRRMAWLVAGGALVVVCSWLAVGEWPNLGAFVIPLLGYLIGLRLGAAWLRGEGALMWCAAQLAIVPIVLLAVGVACLKLAIVAAPLDFEPVRMTEAEKHRLTAWLRDTRPAAGEPRQLRLADAEIDGLCNAALGRGLAERKAQIQTDPAEIRAEASIVLPERWMSHRHFLNIHLDGLVRIDDGQLQLRCDQLEVGRLAVPRIFLRAGARVVRALLLDDPQVREIIESIQLMQPESGAMNTVFLPGALSQRVVPSLVQLIWDRPEVAPQTDIYVRRLVQLFGQLPEQSDRFGALVSAAFTLAAERSTASDPLLENRAAIFALAILLGQEKLEPFIGEILDAKLQEQAAPMMGVVTLRDRSDWPRHFLVSAALALLSSEAASDRIGVLKEQLDSQEGGSGFSFGDLLADRAGTRFALAATRDENSARTLQARLSAGFNVDDYFPPAEGLPEGIPDAAFESRYGGIGGAGYQSLSDEIDRRVEQLRSI